MLLRFNLLINLIVIFSAVNNLQAITLKEIKQKTEETVNSSIQVVKQSYKDTTTWIRENKKKAIVSSVIMAGLVAYIIKQRYDYNQLEKEYEKPDYNIYMHIKNTYLELYGQLRLMNRAIGGFFLISEGKHVDMFPNSQKKETMSQLRGDRRGANKSYTEKHDDNLEHLLDNINIYLGVINSIISRSISALSNKTL